MAMEDDSEIGNRGRVGSAEAAINFNGDRIADINSPSQKKTQMDFSEKQSSRTRELHRARRDIGRHKDTGWAAESAKTQVESELSNANETRKNLSFMIEEASSKAKAQMRDIDSLNKLRKREEPALAVVKNENYEYAQVLRELEYVKQELFKLKLDVAAVLEEKSRAEKEIEASSSNMKSCSRTAQVLRKEIEEANEEQVLVELASMEALKELEDVEAQREKEADEFSFEMESKRKKLQEAIEEIDESKQLEMKLAMTMSDDDVLQNELNLVREMDKRVQRDESMEHMEGHFAEGKESGDPPVLQMQTITEEMEAAKKELAVIREEGFQFMASMDVIRNELKHVTAETARLGEEEAKVNSTVQNLSSKLLRAKSKLEVVSAAEEKAKSLFTSLSHTFDKLKAETEAAKNDKELINQEATTIKAEIRRTEFEVDTTEERLQGAMQELEAIKASEALALEKLKTLMENTMRGRALAARHSSLITISKFEYEYLTKHAAEAGQIADKKVAAARAWIEALKASEKEILIKTKIAQREIKETKLEEELEVNPKEELPPKRAGGEELENWPRKRERNSNKNLQRPMSRKNVKSNGIVTPARQPKFQKSASPATGQVSPFTTKKRKNVIPNLTKFLRGKRNSRTL